MYKIICYTAFKNAVLPISYDKAYNKPYLYNTHKQATTQAIKLMSTQHPSCVQKAIIKTCQIVKQ
jgi:hypothetical protein